MWLTAKEHYFSHIFHTIINARQDYIPFQYNIVNNFTKIAFQEPELIA